jgi:hypothetical protein
MKILDRLSKSPPPADPGEAGDASPAEASSPDEGQLPIKGYDKLDDKELRPRLSTLSQEELAAVKSYELAHQNRPVVLNRMHWLEGTEPMPGYDALSTEAIVEGLAGADAATLKAVREYERHHRDRRDVLVEVARALPSAPVSAGEDQAQKDQKALVREGFADREKTAGGIASGEAPESREGRNGLGPDA